MIGSFLIIAGTIGAIYYIDKDTDKRLKGIQQDNSKSVKESKEVSDLEFIKSRYREVYTNFRDVKSYLKRVLGNDSEINDILETIDSNYLLGGKISSDEGEREPVLKYLELLLSQSVEWSRLKDVTNLYKNDSLEPGVVDLITNLVNIQYDSFIELEEVNKKEREEAAIILLGELSDEKVFSGNKESILLDSNSIVDLKKESSNLFETNEKLERLLSNVEDNK